jgi:hypothetical protein
MSNKLPDGKVCGECVYYDAPCKEIVDNIGPKSTTCHWDPSRFAEQEAQVRLGEAPPVQTMQDVFGEDFIGKATDMLKSMPLSAPVLMGVPGGPMAGPAGYVMGGQLAMMTKCVDCAFYINGDCRKGPPVVTLGDDGLIWTVWPKPREADGDEACCAQGVPRQPSQESILKQMGG